MDQQTRPDHMEHGGSYVINADQSVTLKERGRTEAEVISVAGRRALMEAAAKAEKDAKDKAPKGAAASKKADGDAGSQ